MHVGVSLALLEVEDRGNAFANESIDIVVQNSHESNYKGWATALWDKTR